MQGFSVLPHERAFEALVAADIRLPEKQPPLFVRERAAPALAHCDEKQTIDLVIQRIFGEVVPGVRLPSIREVQPEDNGTRRRPLEAH